jgi:hypothetical protein
MSEMAQVTVDDFTVSSSSESEEELRANMQEATEEVKDGPPPDPKKESEERKSKAAAELGKAGGEAAAKKRAEEAKQAKAAEGSKPKAEDTEDDEETNDDEKPLGKPRHDPRARVLEATRKEAEARRALAEAERDRQELQQRLGRLEGIAKQAGLLQDEQAVERPQSGGASGPKPPQASDYDDYSEYVRDLARFEGHQLLQEHMKRAQEQQHYETLTRQAVGVVEQFRSRLPQEREFTERVRPELLEAIPSFLLSPKDVNALTDLAQEIVLAEKPSDVMVYISEHPEHLVACLQAKDKRELVRAFARVEAAIEREGNGNGAIPAPAPKKASSARPPITPVSTAGHSRINEEDSDEESFEDMMARREKQRKRA